MLHVAKMYSVGCICVNPCLSAEVLLIVSAACIEILRLHWRTIGLILLISAERRAAGGGLRSELSCQLKTRVHSHRLYFFATAVWYCSRSTSHTLDLSILITLVGLIPTIYPCFANSLCLTCYTSLLVRYIINLHIASSSF